MTKKKVARPTILKAFVATIDKLKVTSPEKLKIKTLQQAYGLAPTVPGDSLHLPSCSNRWLEPELEMEVSTTTERIIIDSEDDDPIVFTPPPSKSKSKGKGKEEVKVKVVCSATECANNPKCSNWLGQDKWENSVKALEAFQKAAGLGFSPTRPRIPELPVGLKNLGATCYVNSLLQVWFQDETFRAGVYACQPPEKDSPLFQLQLCFAFLQNAQQSVYNPSPLVASLKLDATEQQDVQEFSKLFMNLLDHEFKKQNNVDKLVSDQFEGQITYGTECSACNKKSGRQTKFFELEVNLQKNCKLEDRIAESLRDEEMDGENQYYCEDCDKKVDATRYTTLEAIPPVLHFSLLRFVFSAESFERSKSNHAISYPLKLDMGQFLPADNGVHPVVWYDLKGVLMHKGQSAHHGHYVAQVYDNTEKKWFLFDDEVVSEIDDLNAPDKYDEDGAVMSSKTIKTKLAAGFTRGKDGDVLPKSKDAYMLVYTRRVIPSLASTPIITTPPSVSLEMVAALDAEHLSLASAWDISAISLTSDFEKIRDAKRSVYRVWDVEEGENSYLVNRAELKRWIAEGLTPLKINKPKEKSPTIVEDSGISLNGKDDSPDTSMTIGVQAHNPRMSENIMKVEEADATKVEEEIARDSITMVTNHDLLCQHSYANPGKAEHMKQIGQKGVDALRELGVTIEPELLSEEALCRTCVFGIVHEIGYTKSHIQDVESVNAVISNDTPSAYISKSWYNDWSKENPKMHVNNSIADPNPSSGSFADDVICMHGALQPDIKLRRSVGPEAQLLLESIFPGWVATSSDLASCNRCDRDLLSSKEQAEAERVQIKKEKATFKPFDLQRRLGATQFILSESDDNYLIPYNFPREWTKWSKQILKLAHPRPSEINNEQFLCEHGMVKIDIESEAELPTLVHVVSGKDWKNLTKLYNAGPPIKIFENGSYSCIPAICQECLNGSRLNFSTTQLKIRILDSLDLDKDGNRIFAETIATEAETSSRKRGISPAPAGSRVSKRLKTKTAKSINGVIKVIEMDKNDTVKDLRIKIQDNLKIPTIYQRLFHRCIELESSQTVAELGLCGGDVVELYEVTVDEGLDLSLLDDTIDEKSLAKSRGGKKVRQEGFGNTGLLGFDQQFKSDRMEILNESAEEEGNHSGRSSTEVQELMQGVVQENENLKACSICTVVQSVENDQCLVCGAEL